MNIIIVAVLIPSALGIPVAPAGDQSGDRKAEGKERRIGTNYTIQDKKMSL